MYNSIGYFKRVRFRRFVVKESLLVKRRLYYNWRFNDFWYMDRYDKLKFFGFFIYGVIDGFSNF